MNRVFALCLVFILSACSQSMNASHDRESEIGFSGPSKYRSRAIGPAETDPSKQKRLVAYRHRISFAVPAAQIHTRFEGILAECVKLGCVVQSADEVMPTAQSAGSANLVARIPPASFDKLFASAGQGARLIAHRRDSEDLTDSVIDVDAHIKNLTEVRARILELLAKKTGNLKDILDAEKELAETQAALDTINGKRKGLANQIEMVAVELELEADSLRAEDSLLAPLAEAANSSGKVLMSSLGGLITTTIAVLPWLLVLIPLLHLLRRWWRKRKAGTAT